MIGHGPGRGAWLCAENPDCFEKAAERGSLGRALRADVAPEAIAGLRDGLVAFRGHPPEST